MSSLAFFRPSIIRQNFPPAPTFTEENVPDLTNKVYIITGSNTGVGKELARILYAANAAVYMACRTESKARKAIQDIKAAAPLSVGQLEYLSLDLSDLKSVKQAAEQFAVKEDKLHVLFNNAAVMLAAEGLKTVQGYDLQLGTNCLGHFLFTQLLVPVLKRTARIEPVGSVRVVWVSSMAAELSPVKSGLDMSNLRGSKDYITQPDAMGKYGISKAGNYLHSVEFARLHKQDNILSVLYRSVDEQKTILRLGLKIFTRVMLYPVVNGACSELFAGLSPEVTMQKTGSWIGPFGRFFNIRNDIAVNAKPVDEGGQGVAEDFWEWSLEQVKQYM